MKTIFHSPFSFLLFSLLFFFCFLFLFLFSFSLFSLLFPKICSPSSIPSIVFEKKRRKKVGMSSDEICYQIEKNDFSSVQSSLSMTSADPSSYSLFVSFSLSLTHSLPLFLSSVMFFPIFLLLFLSIFFLLPLNQFSHHPYKYSSGERNVSFIQCKHHSNGRFFPSLLAYFSYDFFSQREREREREKRRERKEERNKESRITFPFFL